VAYGLMNMPLSCRKRTVRPLMYLCRPIGPALIAIVLAGSACGSESPGSTQDPGYEPQLIAMPAKAGEKCRRDEVLRPVCPTRVPKVNAGTFQHITGPQPDWPVFSAEWNAPYPKLTERNAPPRLAHVVVHAEHPHMFPFKWPSDTFPQGSEIKDKRKEALLLDDPTWAGLQGTLVLAPSFPAGGIDGDHIVFRWEKDGHVYAISLHAWRPLNEATATLRAIVESIP
jgi:hypothetical protein